MEVIISIIVVILVAVWVFKDGEKRYPEKSSAPGYWALGTFLILIVFFPLYLIFRPKKKKEVKDEKLSSGKNKELSVSNFCSQCGYKVENNNNFCPNCGEKL